MLQVAGVAKAYGPQVLFQDVSFRLDRGSRVALVGPNGAGKSTLFAMILGEIDPDEGEISTEKGIRIGHLPQETAPAGGETVLEIAAGVTGEHARLLEFIGRREREGRTEDRYHEAVARYGEIGGFEIEPRAKRILAGLAFREGDLHRPARTLSGGWVMRAHLARLLTAEPDLLMLDEPTNHLDLESLQWFQNHLRNYPGALLLISHDRAFLNTVVGGIFEVRHHRIHSYRGNYDDYLKEAAARDARQLAAFRAQERKIAHLERFVERFGAQATKASQAKSKQKQIDRIERIEAPRSAEKTIRVRFPQPPASGQKVVSLEGVHFAYGDLRVYQGIDFVAEKGQRTVLVGPNGAGKSTLLKLLAGVLRPDAGTRTLGHNVRCGYFSQSRIEMLDPARTVLEEVRSIRNPVGEATARTVLGSFLFRGEAVFKKVSVLSGGEKSRLGLVKLLLDPPNLLLMDEPTTHLDMASIDALLGALEHYTGTLVFISHDVYFIRRMAKTVLRVSGGQLTPFAGDYDYYLRKSEARGERQGLTAGAAPGDFRPGADRPEPAGEKAPGGGGGFKSKERKRAEAEERRRLAKQRAEVEALEGRICDLEEKQALLSSEMENPELYETHPARVMELNREVIAIGEELERLNERWFRMGGEQGAGGKG
ncbi:MAG: ABC-F family ATP-binding cassette domain-containing protein [Puniceicoccaceae bacterium]